jgi:FtsP/CotA-like multicopper oxidase with cupredoxin domain
MDMGILDRNLTVDGILKNEIERPKNSNENPPLKDTIQIPNAGYVRVKFKADNPGFWIGHCHFDFHL